jgi:hypothetical protein
LHTPFDPQSGYQPVLPHESGYSEFNIPLAAAIVRGETVFRDKTRPESPVGNPYGPHVEYLQRTTANDDAHLEWQVSPTGGDDVDHGNDPPDIPQLESEDITQIDSKDIAQPKALALPVLKENEVWTIGMFRPITMYMYVYIYIYIYIYTYVCY